MKESLPYSHNKHWSCDCLIVPFSNSSDLKLLSLNLVINSLRSRLPNIILKKPKNVNFCWKSRQVFWYQEQLKCLRNPLFFMDETSAKFFPRNKCLKNARYCFVLIHDPYNNLFRSGQRDFLWKFSKIKNSSVNFLSIWNKRLISRVSLALSTIFFKAPLFACFAFSN